MGSSAKPRQKDEMAITAREASPLDTRLTTTILYEFEASITEKVMLDLLDWDERPIVVLDSAYVSNGKNTENNVHMNLTLKSEPGLVDDLLGQGYDGRYSEEQIEFWRWAKAQDTRIEHGNELPSKKAYGEWEWIKLSFRERWRIVRGTRVSPSEAAGNPFLAPHLERRSLRPRYPRETSTIRVPMVHDYQDFQPEESVLEGDHYDTPQSSKRKSPDDTKVTQSYRLRQTESPSSKKARIQETHAFPSIIPQNNLPESLAGSPFSELPSKDERVPGSVSFNDSDLRRQELTTPTSITNYRSRLPPVFMNSSDIQSNESSYSVDKFDPNVQFRLQRSMSEQAVETKMQILPTSETVPIGTKDAMKNDSGCSQRSSITVTGEDIAISHQIDWTLYHVPSPTKFIDFFRHFDWSSKLPGPIKSWSDQLRSLVFMMTSDPEPSLILWGDHRERSMIYNEACISIFGSKHPAAMGAKPEDVFAELWELILPGIEQVERGKSTQLLDICVPMIRHGYLEETFWCITDLPILSNQGVPLGCYCRLTESTSKAIAERKIKMLLTLGEASASATNLKNLWPKILRAFEDTDDTMPFAFIYSVVDDQSTQSSKESTPTAEIEGKCKLCVLESTMGIQCEYLPRELYLSDFGEHLAINFRRAWKLNEPIFLKHEDGTLPEQLRHPVPGRGGGQPCEVAAICPIRFVQEHHLVAFVVLGLNPRRPLKEQTDYVKLLNRRLLDGAASVFLPEEERRNAEALHAADLQQAAIASQLLSMTKEARNRQNRFMRLSENAPVGMYLFSPNGDIIFINDAYLDMLGIRRDDFEGAYGWASQIVEEDLPSVNAAWRKVAEERLPIVVEFRVKRPFKFIDEDGVETIGETWIMSSAFPQTSEEGEVDSVIGWQTDISHRKYAESLQKQRLQDALESKRQSENFIDMTSHEMRNPLSAILQSSDGIMIALPTLFSKSQEPTAETKEVINTIADNAQTIILCAQHQKRIVDDILALSKLDSNLLIITPDKADPIAIAEHVLKMYEGELQRHDIETKLLLADQYKDYRIDYLYLDPTRLIQVLINLLSNAIKFTQSRHHRSITITICASADGPPSSTYGGSFFSKKHRTNPSSLEAVDASHPSFGDPIFLQFSVSDSGCGLSEEETESLFQRFSQATPRTHVKYGGSGLGLFISRELTEMQGGQIGVSSKLGTGSTFFFYIKAWRFIPTFSRPKSVVEATALPFTTAALNQLHPTSPKKPKLPEKLHVLVVEDNLINQKVMATQLRRLGCIVYVANHGQEALKILEKSTLWAGSRNGMDTWNSATPVAQADTKPEPLELHIILMDVEMPIMDGLTCVREIRRLQAEHRFVGHVPVIAVTANARDAQKTEAVEMGMDMVVTKPFRIPDLVPQMEKLILETQVV